MPAAISDICEKSRTGPVPCAALSRRPRMARSEKQTFETPTSTSEVVVGPCGPTVPRWGSGLDA